MLEQVSAVGLEKGQWDTCRKYWADKSVFLMQSQTQQNMLLIPTFSRLSQENDTSEDNMEYTWNLYPDRASEQGLIPEQVSKQYPLQK